ncbi:AbrB/MazE/SpoVT family DNA-binding domain-containing protein [Methylocystis sp. H62]|jgi:AbrB family looped-hinge helix DNA binding protein|uniref:AbrB/MazE/SpoVT family DNA-binding domain-containing protein n=1 Tax=Methylocystis sp. H62 TaxID=2785789 RepID=UPI0011D57E86|nr:AbrB/MazE/SpoVT family DNA-binding domain-containing protein [Methylocystis sp. H62]KAF0212672.1 MAG: AbrB family transcriptional [Methylocystaceae bacterium]MBG0795147.1 AbrB/MazE/SpoVT family DNA-binding domain-containing protein [Methylocystis sp. H62]TXT48267.1 MAG: AbrB family transcriptional regulator [Methylocystaceae bacterium]
MSTKVTIKGQVTLPKAVREAAGIRPGDRVSVRARPEGGVLVERSDAAQADPAPLKAARSKIERALAALDRKGVKFRTTTDEWMRLLRGDD